MIQQVSGRLVAVGSSGKSGGGTRLALHALTSNGQPDSSFAGTGSVTLDFGTGSTQGFALAQDTRVESLALYVTGAWDGNGSDAAMVVARYTADGGVDATLLGPGVRYNGTAPAGHALALGQDAKPLIGGVLAGNGALWQVLR
jgi:hypothetical protein